MRESDYDRDLNNAMERHFSVGQDDEPNEFGDVLADGVAFIIEQKDKEIAAWKQIAYNLSCAMELNGLKGIDSLKQQMDAHGVKQ